MSNKILLVTGGSRGIGAATARLSAQRGYRVFINYRGDVLSALETVAGIEREGGKAFAIQADVSVESEVVRMFEEVGHLDALVNNAATLEKQMRLDQMDAGRIGR